MIKKIYKYFYIIQEKYLFRQSHNTLSPIDILIPATYKDFLLLPHVVNHAIKNIQHKISHIFIIIPHGTEICRELQHLNNIYFIDEDIFNINRQLFNDYIITVNKENPAQTKKIDRRGWLLQQFIKLSGDKLCEEEKFLVLDSDTVLVKKQAFESMGKDILLFSDEYHKPYYDCFERIFGYKPVDTLSFVSHHMLFEKKFLSELKNEIESKNGKDWITSIISHCDFTNPSCFSEYETYGHWMLKNNSSKIIRQYFFNYSLSRKSIENIDSIINRNKMLKSISLHSYIDEYE